MNIEDLGAIMTDLWAQVKADPARKTAILLSKYQELKSTGEGAAAHVLMTAMTIYDIRENNMPEKNIVINVINSDGVNLNLESQIGSINTSIQKLSTGEASSAQLADALKALSEGILNSAELEPKTKTEAADLLADIGAEAEKDQSNRSSGRIKAALGMLPTLIGAAAHLTKLWEHFAPIAKAYFQIH